MRISLFESDTNTQPNVYDVTWETHIEGLRQCAVVDCPTTTKVKGVDTPAPVCPSHVPNANKCEARRRQMWSPCVYNGTRSDANVIGMSCVTLDLDHLTEEQITAVCLKVDELGWACIMHSTHSHNPNKDDHCYRLVFPVTEELTREQIKPTRDWVQAQLGVRADEQTKDLSRAYYLPSRPKRGPPYVFSSVTGKAIEPVAGFAPVVASYVQPTATGVLQTLEHPERTNGDMHALKKALSKKVVGDPLVKRCLAGDRLADQGARDSALNQLAGKLVFGLPPDASIEAIVEFGRQSVCAMDPPEHGTWMEVWRDKVERAIQRRAGELAKIKERNDIAKAFLCSHAAYGEPEEEATDGPFPLEKVELWAQEMGFPNAAAFQKQWMIRHRGGHWVFCNGRYKGMVPDSDIEYSLARDLVRAPVRLTAPDKLGQEMPRPIKQILHDYATVARNVSASLALQKSYYDPGHQTFHEAVCPIRPELRPRSHPEVHEWLEILGGPVLLDWVACVTKLDKPAAALYIDGDKGTGKNVLADGLAHIWHKGNATAFKDVVGTAFNDAITRCPLIHADEGIPKTDTIIDDLRRLIGSSGMPLNRKFLPVVNLKGCPRLIITANNSRVLLDTGATLGPQDIEAVTQRIRRLHANIESARHLEKIRNEKGYEYIQAWVDHDKIAEHALWLRENREVNEKTRFLVEGVDPAQAEQMTTGTGHVSATMEFLSRYLSDSSAVKSPRIIVGNGELLVNTEALADKHIWERYVPSRKIPSARVLSDSLRAVSEEEPATVQGLEYFRVKSRILIEWSKTNQVGSSVMIEAKVRRADG